MKRVSELLGPIVAAGFRPTVLPPVDVVKWAAWFKFDLRRGSKDENTMRGLVTACARFCIAMKNGAPPYWLSLLGTSGAGKTFLAKRIMRWHRAVGHFRDSVDDKGPKGFKEVVYAREWCWWPQLAGLLKGNDGYGQLRDVESSGFAVFDEIGAELDKSGHVTNCLANALCARVGKWTLITSNKPLGQIGREIDTRVASRMVRDGSEVVDVDVEDFALWQKRGKQL